MSLFLKCYYYCPDPQLPKTAAAREIVTYRDLLEPAALGTPRFYAAMELDRPASAILLFEYIESPKLTKITDPVVWRSAVGWLARMHRHFYGHRERLGLLPALYRQDERYFLETAYRAAEMAARISPQHGLLLRRVSDAYDCVARPLASANTTLIHGEYYCTNIRVQLDANGPRICPFDWESAAEGCLALDLAYFLRQKTDFSESSMIDAYLEAWAAAGGPSEAVEDLTRDIVRCRLHELMCRVQRRTNSGLGTAERMSKYAQLAAMYLEKL